MSQWYEGDYLTIGQGTGHAWLALHSRPRDGVRNVRIGRMVRDSSRDCPTCGARRRTVYAVTLHDGTLETIIGRQAAMDRLVYAWREQASKETVT